MLLAPLLPGPAPEPSLPSGGGTFDATIGRADSAQALPSHRWSHLAVTYDGTAARLFIDGDEVASHSTTGRILGTPDPLWIGGNHPYGEHFKGLIDEVRIYDRALTPGQLGAEMATPIARATGPTTTGLVGAWGFDRGSGRWALDASGEGNRGKLIGASWAPRGRFGEALRFGGAGALVRVAASPSLDLGNAITISAWVKPAGPERGWRTVVHRQTDAYFLMASGAPTIDGGADSARAGFVVAAMVGLCLALLLGRARWIEVGASWWPPVALFLVGSTLDVWLKGPGTVIGPSLVAIWYALTARHRVVAISMFGVAAVLVLLTAAALATDLGGDLSRDGGGVARSAALGLVLLVAGLLAARADPRQAA